MHPLRSSQGAKLANNLRKWGTVRKGIPGGCPPNPDATCVATGTHASLYEPVAYRYELGLPSEDCSKQGKDSSLTLRV